MSGGMLVHLVFQALCLIHHAIVISLLVQAVYPGECLLSIKVSKATLNQNILAPLTLLVNLEVLFDRLRSPSAVSFLWNNSLAKSFDAQVNPRLKFWLRLCEVYMLLCWHLYIPETCGNNFDVY